MRRGRPGVRGAGETPPPPEWGLEALRSAGLWGDRPQERGRPSAVEG